MSGISIILKTLQLDKNISIEEIAKGADIPLENIRSLIAGKNKITINTAQKLSEFFQIPAEFFFTDQSQVNHNNIGTKSNSNSGYIGTYQND